MCTSRRTKISRRHSWKFTHARRLRHICRASKNGGPDLTCATSSVFAPIRSFFRLGACVAASANDSGSSDRQRLVADFSHICTKVSPARRANWFTRKKSRIKFKLNSLCCVERPQRALNNFAVTGTLLSPVHPLGYVYTALKMVRIEKTFVRSTVVSEKLRGPHFSFISQTGWEHSNRVVQSI